MARTAPILAGLLATLAAAWLSHGPLGGGEALVSDLERQARAAVAQAELPGIEVKLVRDPLSRNAMLSGAANDVQREGMGSHKGINDHVGDVEGIAAVGWSDAPRPGGAAMPLLAETMILASLAYLLGLGLGWLLWGRRRRDRFA